jgi:hypothetical protein
MVIDSCHIGISPGADRSYSGVFIATFRKLLNGDIDDFLSGSHSFFLNTRLKIINIPAKLQIKFKTAV